MSFTNSIFELKNTTRRCSKKKKTFDHYKNKFELLSNYILNLSNIFEKTIMQIRNITKNVINFLIDDFVVRDHYDLLIELKTRLIIIYRKMLKKKSIFS